MPNIFEHQKLPTVQPSLKNIFIIEQIFCQTNAFMENNVALVLLDAATFGEIDLSPITSLDPRCHVYPTTPDEVAGTRLAEATIAVSNKVLLTRELMERSQDLELICIAATGTNNVDLEAAQSLGIAVTNVPGYSTPSVVSHTFAMYFHLAHQTAYHERYTQTMQWCKSPTFTHLAMPYEELAGKTWGIVGMGAIGRGVAVTASAFGCKVIYHSTSGTNLDQPYPHVSLEELISQADVISIHCPLNSQTQNLITHRQLLRMKPNAILLNPSRGGIVHEGDLAVALDLGVIAGAGLDVMTTEPPPQDHAFWQMEHHHRLLVTPHIAGLSLQARTRLIAEVAACITNYRKGESYHRLV